MSFVRLTLMMKIRTVFSLFSDTLLLVALVVSLGLCLIKKNSRRTQLVSSVMRGLRARPSLFQAIKRTPNNVKLVVNAL